MRVFYYKTYSLNIVVIKTIIFVQKVKSQPATNLLLLYSNNKSANKMMLRIKFKVCT